MNLWTIDAKGNLATLGEWPDRGRETMKAFNRSGAVAGIFTTADGTLLSTLNNPNTRQLDALKRFAEAVLKGGELPKPLGMSGKPSAGIGPQLGPGKVLESSTPATPMPAEVCPSPTLPPAPPPAPREPAPVRQLPVRPRPAPAPPAPPPAAATAAPPAPASDLDKALDAWARTREDLERTTAQLGDVTRERDTLARRVTELETLSRRAAELEAIAAEASAHATAQGIRAERLALELATADATAQSAVAALARETARADGLVADLARRDNSPRVLAAVATRRVRVAVPAPRAQHPMAAIADHLRRRAGR